MDKVITGIGVILLYVLLVVAAFFVGVAGMVYGYGLEVRSWSALIWALVGSTFIHIMIKSITNLLENGK